MDTPLQSNKFALEFNNLKDILLHSKNNKDTEVECTVQPSRFRSILAQVKSFNGNADEEYIDMLNNRYSYFKFNSIEIGDSNNNTYTIIKDLTVNEKKRKCSECDCGNKRFVNEKTGICFYKELTTTNYTTKIKSYVNDTKS